MSAALSTATRPEIDTSWHRSALNGLMPDAVPEVAVDEDVSNCAQLLRISRPILEVAADQLADTDVALLLTDRESRLISRVFGGTAVERNLDRLGAVHGSYMPEDAVGTTALGTPTETRQPIEVNGDEHFLDVYKHLSCYGFPILHPVTNRLECVLCMTSVGVEAHPLFRPFVQRIASEIRAGLLEHSRSAHQQLVDTYHRIATRRQIAVVALGDDVQLLNNAAVDQTDPTDIAVLRSIAASSLAVPPTVTLSSGRTVELHGERVPACRGMVFALVPSDDRIHPPRRSSYHRGNSCVFDVPSFVVSADRSLAVTGAPGTGRSSYARLAINGARAEIIDASGCLAARSRPDILGATGAARASGSVLVVDNADALTDGDATTLRHVIAQRKQPVVVVTGPAADSSASVAALCALCTDRVDLAPIRHRPKHIAAASNHFLRQHSPAGARLHAAALDALVAHSWPANYTELDRVVERAVEHAASCGHENLIELTDLPRHLRVSGRPARLTLHERVERQGIIDALADCDGNKVHAAKQLGISRSTLYARIRSLAIEL